MDEYINERTKHDGSPQVAALAARTTLPGRTRGGTRGRRQPFPVNERRNVEGAHRKAGR